MTENMPKRPGWVTFAAILMVLTGMFSIVMAISTFTSASWVSGLEVSYGAGSLWISGIIDLVIAGGSFYAAYSLTQGGKFGFYLSFMIAGMSAVKWFFLLFFDPYVAVVFLAIDFLIMYGLAKSADYFDEYARLGIGS